MNTSICCTLVICQPVEKGQVIIILDFLANIPVLWSSHQMTKIGSITSLNLFPEISIIQVAQSLKGKTCFVGTERWMSYNVFSNKSCTLIKESTSRMPTKCLCCWLHRGPVAILLKKRNVVWSCLLYYIKVAATASKSRTYRGHTIGGVSIIKSCYIFVQVRWRDEVIVWMILIRRDWQNFRFASRTVLVKEQ